MRCGRKSAYATVQSSGARIENIGRKPGLRACGTGQQNSGGKGAWHKPAGIDAHLMKVLAAASKNLKPHGEFARLIRKERSGGEGVWHQHSRTHSSNSEAQAKGAATPIPAGRGRSGK
mmetsp:Transcript_58525/g.169817  ORF Transcript_58525/g.169817 Transcript_58525/m.169817 type:complete len:118 (+) Transcript_58525:83-436(+)